MPHLLVTNDFPPKIGGIQSYLWELWRRFPSGEATVLTTPYANDRSFDEAAPMRIVRTRQRWLLPTPVLRRQILALAHEIGTDLVLLDPAIPVGRLGPALRAEGLRYGVILHGAEVTIPGRVPLLHGQLAKVLRGAELSIAAGNYPLAEAERAAGRKLASIVIPPGVDVNRFVPLPHEPNSMRAEQRKKLGLPEHAPMIICTSRLVPRKGFDVVIDAAALLAHEFPGLVVAISGGGRDRERLERRAKAAEPRAPQLDVRFLGRVSDADLVTLLQVGDVHAMLCRNRWGGLEQEGFGIVFLEAAAAGTPQVAGASGGSAEAVVDGETGLVVQDPKSPMEAANALRKLLADPALRRHYATAGRSRVECDLTYDILAERLFASIVGISTSS
jgi:phosphatidyl-myo-inositol dimannoside synthase